MKALNTKLLIVIVVLLGALVAVAGYFMHERQAEKALAEKQRIFEDEDTGIDFKKIYGAPFKEAKETKKKE